MNEGQRKRQVGQRLKEARENADYKSVYSAARALGISRTSLGNAEAGVSEFRTGIFARVVELYHGDAHTILGLELE